MIFNTAWFWLFLPAALLSLRVTPSRYRKTVALALCLAFHFHFAGAAGMSAVLILGCAVYLAGVYGDRVNRYFWTLGIALSVAVLGYAKYRGYFGTLFGKSWPIAAVPLGISFFTFEFVHYLAELRKGGKPITSALDFSLFTVFFPSLVACPIKRYPDFIVQANAKSAFFPTSESIMVGGTRFLIGALKKTALADPLTLMSDQLYLRITANASTGSAWLLALTVALRIYFDFSAYSDMAIGSARMLNIRLPENFNWPYLSSSLQEFWRRWHISLSSWIRDYVYVPLGGNRASVPRRFANFLIAFGLCGLWHGAESHFVIWGLWHGAGLGLERAAMSTELGQNFFRGFTGWASTSLYVALGWLLFFYPVNEAKRIAMMMFGIL